MNLNHKSIIVSAVLAAAGASAFAVEAEQFVPPTSSSLTREEVRAELRELRAAGAWQSVNEASATPLEALEMDRKVAQVQSSTRIAQQAFPTSEPVAAMDPLLSERVAAYDRGAQEAGNDYRELAGTPNEATTTVWVPENSAVVIEMIPAEESEVAPQRSEIFQHPAVRREGDVSIEQPAEQPLN